MEATQEKRKLGDDDEGDGGREGPPERKKSAQDVFTKKDLSCSMDCPVAKVGIIIGRKGVNVNEMMKRSGCRIVIDQNPFDGISRKIGLTGPAEGLAVAMSLISRILSGEHLFDSHGKDNATGGDSDIGERKSNEMPCPPEKVGMIIGRSGATVNEIFKRTGCKIQVIQDGIGEDTDRIVKFTGSESQVVEAKAMVTGMLTTGMSFLDPSVEVITTEHDIQPAKVGSVIGAKGSVITDVMKRSGCKLVINQKFPEGEPHKVVYTGTREQIEIAKSLVESILRSEGRPFPLSSAPRNSGGATAQQEMKIFRAQVGFVLGHQRSTLFDLQKRFNVRMTVDDGLTGVHKLTINGELVAVQAAMRAVYQILDQTMGMSQSSDMDPRHDHRMDSRMDPRMDPRMEHHMDSRMDHREKPPLPMYQPHHDSGVYVSSMHNATAGGQFPATPFGRPGPAQYSQQPHSYPQTQPQHEFQQHQTQYLPPETHQFHKQAAPIVSGSFSLGSDGTAGLLEPPTVLAGGMHCQVAKVKNDCIGRIIGKGGATLQLIHDKSGASLATARRPDGTADSTDGSTKLTAVGSPSSVTLATQMLQEILVNGTANLLLMPNVPESVPSNYATVIGQQKGAGISSSTPPPQLQKTPQPLSSGVVGHSSQFASVPFSHQPDHQSFQYPSSSFQYPSSAYPSLYTPGSTVPGMDLNGWG